MNKQLEIWNSTGMMPYHTKNYIPFNVDYEYLRWAQPILDQPEKGGRTETPVHEFFGTPQSEFDLSLGFPLVTTKHTSMHAIKVELMWMLQGDTNIKYLTDRNVKIWNEWADADGELGPVYGAQWTRWENPNGSRINQIENLVAEINRARNSKGMFVTAWNPSDIGFEKVKIRSCHAFFQCNVTVDGYLNLKMYQRSADWFLGVPYNIASYALLLHMLAQVTGYKPGRVINTYGSAHLYANHVEQIKEQLTREPRPLPTIELNPDIKNIFDFKPSDIVLNNYHPHPALKGEITI
jgi:thymidylate synthase